MSSCEELSAFQGTVIGAARTPQSCCVVATEAYARVFPSHSSTALSRRTRRKMSRAASIAATLSATSPKFCRRWAPITLRSGPIKITRAASATKRTSLPAVVSPAAAAFFTGTAQTANQKWTTANPPLAPRTRDETVRAAKFGLALERKSRFPKLLKMCGRSLSWIKRASHPGRTLTESGLQSHRLDARHLRK